jgi:hypothetical protein
MTMSAVVKAFELYVDHEAQLVGERHAGSLLALDSKGEVQLQAAGGDLWEAIRKVAVEAAEVLIPGGRAVCEGEGGKLMVLHSIASTLIAAADEKQRRLGIDDLKLLCKSAAYRVAEQLARDVKEMRKG